MSQYSFSKKAIQDLNAICDYIATTNPKSASQLFDDIRKKCKLVADFPNMGKRYSNLRENLRGFVIRGYIVFYYPRADGIDVIKVASGYQDLERLFQKGDN